MNTMKWLVKREFWEHKGGFFWAPIVVAGIMLFFLAATVVSGVVMGHSHGFNIDGDSLTVMSHAMTPSERNDFAQGLATSYMGLAAPIYLVLTVVVFFFGLGALFDDLKDRSVLFWKSLPISDHATVLSKVAMALVIAPLVTIAVGTVATLAMLVVICLGAAALGVNVVGGVLSNAGLYLSPFEVVGMLPVYALWALPTIGWLMMVSAWARTKPFLWAIGIPVLAGTLLTWLNAIFSLDWNVRWFWHYIVGRGLGGTAPGIWFVYHPDVNGVGESVIDGPNGMVIHRHADDMGTLMMQSWNMFTTADMWIGVVLGAAMIYVAIRLRRWRDEG
jgi:ABC-2 type transport system permease protein